jgi:hypothetical protein
VPPALDVQVICDNYGTHKTPAITAWLGRHPRFHLHFTPTGSSWINQVERWFWVPDRPDAPPGSPQERPGPGDRHPRLGC